MRKGIILRVVDGTVLSPELSRTLDELLPNHKIEYFQNKPDYAQSIEHRIDSLHDAFLFILDAYPLDPKFTNLNADTLRNYAQLCKGNCDLTKGSVEELHKELEKYTAKLVDVLSVGWEWPKGKAVKEAIACLNEAEQYVLMGKGRYDLATLTPIQIGTETEYVLQLDESLPPYYDQIVTELETLKENNYPKTPAWFRHLSEYQQAYFCNLDIKKLDATAVMQDFNNFMSIWDEAQKNSLSLTSDLNKIKNHAAPYPNWFNSLNMAQQAMVRVLSEDPASFDSHLRSFKKTLIELATKLTYNRTLGLIPRLPQWYWVLPKTQQSFLAQVLKKEKNVEDAVSFISSRHRTLPLPANFAAHSLIKLNKNGDKEVFFGRRFRSSHIASRDCLDFPEAVQQRHGDANLAQVKSKAREGQFRLLQTLISPIHALDYVPSAVTDFLPELPPDLELYKIARAAVKRSENALLTLQHNHPFNIAKIYYYTKADDPDSLLLLEIAGNYVSTIPGLKELLTDYENLLNSPLGTATFWDYDGRELFLSSLEQIITLTFGGYSYGSCVSGKDRKAIELMHTDAMILYKAKYGSWPKFGDPKEKTERVNFVEILTDLYMSRHQHVHAGQNAPGSEGIKTPAMYLPKDVADAINKRLGTEKGLDYDDRLATDNEVKNISKDLKNNLLPENELLCKLMARQLGELQCTRLYDSLSALINEERRFQPKTWGLGWFDSSKKESGGTPTGIQSIRELMLDEHAGKNNVNRMEKIFATVLSRPEADTSRTKETNSVYSRIRDMLRPLKSGLNLDKAAEDAVTEWSQLFEESKRCNSMVVY
jgi:hypothetical protein